MANARTRFDTIRDYMVRSHSATSGTLYGKPCALLNGHAFIYFHQGSAAFLLKGRVRLQALAMPGARFWDPLGREGPSMDWIIVPDTHFLRWDRLAIEAVKSAHGLSTGRRPTAAPIAGPPQPPPAAKRWINSIKSLLAKAASLTLAQQEVLPEKPIPRLFAESGANLGDSDASAIAALAEPAVGETAPTPEQAPMPEVPQGRASFTIGEPEAEPDKPAGRASFAIDEPAQTPATAAPPSAAGSAGKASFNIDVSDPPLAAPPLSEPAAEPAAEQSSSPPPFKISEPASSEGRASFSIGADADDKPALKSQVAGRASFDIGGDPEPTVVATEPPLPLEPPPAANAEPDAPSWALSDSAIESEPEPPPAAVTPADGEWADKIAKFQLEATEEGDTGPTPTEGRAVFGAREPDPLPSVEPKFKIKEPEQPMGRASFMVADDAPDAEQSAADGDASEQEPDAADGLDYEPVPKD